MSISDWRTNCIITSVALRIPMLQTHTSRQPMPTAKADKSGFSLAMAKTDEAMDQAPAVEAAAQPKSKSEKHENHGSDKKSPGATLKALEQTIPASSIAVPVLAVSKAESDEVIEQGSTRIEKLAPQSSQPIPFAVAIEKSQLPQELSATPAPLDLKAASVTPSVQPKTPADLKIPAPTDDTKPVAAQPEGKEDIAETAAPSSTAATVPDPVTAAKAEVSTAQKILADVLSSLPAAVDPSAAAKLQNQKAGENSATVGKSTEPEPSEIELSPSKVTGTKASIGTPVSIPLHVAKSIDSLIPSPKQTEGKHSENRSNVDTDRRPSKTNDDNSDSAAVKLHPQSSDPAPSSKESVDSHVAAPAIQVSAQPTTTHVAVAQMGTGPNVSAAHGSIANASSAVSKSEASSLPHSETLPATPLVNSAKLIQNVNGAEMRVGMHSAEFGNVGIRTSVALEQLSIQISVEHGALGTAISKHIPALQEKLGAEQGLHARIEIQDQGAGFSGGLDRRSQDQQQQQQTSQMAPVAFAFTREQRQAMVSPVSGPISTSNDRLDVRA